MCSQLGNLLSSPEVLVGSSVMKSHWVLQEPVSYISYPPSEATWEHFIMQRVRKITWFFQNTAIPSSGGQ